MHRLSQVIVGCLCLLLSGSAIPPAGAYQQSLVTEADMDAALRRSLAEEERARDSIRSVLTREDVRKLASEIGLGELVLDKAVSAIDTLEGEELERAAAHASYLSDRLAGGVTVTISLVALLLIVIVIILLVD